MSCLRNDLCYFDLIEALSLHNVPWTKWSRTYLNSRRGWGLSKYLTLDLILEGEDE